MLIYISQWVIYIKYLFITFYVFRGLLHLENVSYGIEPLESAAAYEHMLYQIKKYKVDFLPLQENHPRTQVVDQSYQILVKSVVSNHLHVIFTCVVLDKMIHIGMCYIWKTNLNGC